MCFARNDQNKRYDTLPQVQLFINFHVRIVWVRFGKDHFRVQIALVAVQNIAGESNTSWMGAKHAADGA